MTYSIKNNQIDDLRKKSENKIRKRFLIALIKYANKSRTVNPHFYKEELMKLLKVDELTFNIMKSTLDNKYCHYVDQFDGKERFKINVSQCITLKYEIDKEEKSTKMIILMCILSAVLGVSFSYWFIH